MPSSPTCPCGLPAPYAHCCERWHHGPARLQAPDAEALMRSRYSAYALGLMDYLLDTWHPSTRPPVLEPLPAGLQWLGLSVRQQRCTGPDTAEVEFVARSKIGGKASRLHESSRFVRSLGRWFYLDGDTL